MGTADSHRTLGVSVGFCTCMRGSKGGIRPESLCRSLMKVINFSQPTIAFPNPWASFWSNPSVMPEDWNLVTNVWHAMYIFSTGPGNCNVAGAGGGNWQPTTSYATIELILRYSTNTKMITIVTMVDNTKQTTIRIFAKNFGSKGFHLLLLDVPSKSSHFLSCFFSIFSHFVNHV